MPEIKIADIIQHNLITSGDILESGEKTTFVNSGVIGRDTDIDSQIAGTKSSTTVEIDYLTEPEYSEPEYGDDSDIDITSSGISENSFRAAITFPNKAFGEKSITKILRYNADDNSGLPALSDYFAKYWDLHTQHACFAILKGAISDNKANDNGDLVELVESKFTYGSAIDALAKRGDNIMDSMAHVFMNSTVYKNRLKEKEIDFISEENTGVKLTTWNGMIVHVDNILAPVSGVSTTVFAMPQIFVKSDIDMTANGMNALELDRDPKKGHGAGRTDLISRTGFLLHLAGWDYTKTAQSGVSRNLAETALPENWDRKILAKQSPFVVLETKEG